MQAAVVNVLGEAPKYQPFPEPQAGDGEVLVNVRAAGLHPIVKALASGSHYAAGGDLPMVPGIDGVGTLEDGSRVYFTFARKPWGSMCEQTICPRSKCFPLPEGLDDALAAALPNPGMSAWLSLKDRARVAKGETVLIMGATGVAGQLGLQAARYLGARRVVAAGRNVDAISPGLADTIIALSQPEDAVREALAAEAAHGIDVVIDYLWGRPTELLLEALAKGFRPGGTRAIRLVEVGESAGKTITLPGSILRSIDLTMIGAGLGSARLDAILQTIPRFLELAASGVFRIDVERVPLADVESAWSRVERGRRIVFITGSN